MWVADKWRDYEILDCCSGEKLERWGRYILIRPDPQVIWESDRKRDEWRSADGHYHRSRSGGGYWEDHGLADKWQIRYGADLVFAVKPLGFKHTGLFPEQAVNWEWITKKIKSADREIRVLNLFAYTGGATMAAAKAGASVCHVDAAKGMVAWAGENAALCGLENAPIRYIVDDCVKFVQRELRRGKRYDAVILDPPSYGRGPGGEVWKIEEKLFYLIGLCRDILSDDPLFFLLNSYTAGLAPSILSYMTNTVFSTRFSGAAEADEIGLPVKASGLVLPCGASCRWEKQ